jgi:DNA-binding SARP family transcriptional activator
MPGMGTIHPVGEPPAICVLGPFALGGEAGGGGLSPRQRSVVSALVLGEGFEVGVPTIVDRVWGGDPPATVRKALQVHVVALRAVLGPDRVATTPGGYRLVATTDEIDAWRFEALVQGALRSHEVAARDLGSALDLWRGAPYPDLDGPEATAARVRLAELRALAIDRWAEVLLDRGAVHEAIRVVEPAVLDEPLRERRWALLMVALYRSGRRVESLRAFQRARDALAEAAGLEPGGLLCSLERLVLDDAPELWFPEVLDRPPGTLARALHPAGHRREPLIVAG